MIEIYFYVPLIATILYWGSIFILPQIRGILFLFSFAWTLIVTPFYLAGIAYVGICYLISLPSFDRSNPRHVWSMKKTEDIGDWFLNRLKKRWGITQKRLDDADEEDERNSAPDNDDLIHMHGMYEASKGKKK